jgi:hypothetical protein
LVEFRIVKNKTLVMLETSFFWKLTFAKRFEFSCVFFYFCFSVIPNFSIHLLLKKIWIFFKALWLHCLFTSYGCQKNLKNTKKYFFVIILICVMKERKPFLLRDFTHEAQVTTSHCHCLRQTTPWKNLLKFATQIRCQQYIGQGLF